MNIRTRRRLRNILLVLLAFVLLLELNGQYAEAVGKPQFFTGWVLLVMLVFLALFNVRKKVPFLPLSPVRNWTQLHIYIGILMALVVLVHVEFRMPDSAFGMVFGAMLLLEIVSGIYGIYISRTMPTKLNRYGENVLYERIPVFRRRLREDIEGHVVASLEETGSRTITDFYEARLLPYLEGPRDFWHHLRDTGKPYDRWTRELLGLERYAGERELEILEEIRQLVYRKIKLDGQWAIQNLLKRWLFVHIPLSYGLLVFAVFHLGYSYSFVRG